MGISQRQKYNIVRLDERSFKKKFYMDFVTNTLLCDLPSVTSRRKTVCIWKHWKQYSVITLIMPPIYYHKHCNIHLPIYTLPIISDTPCRLFLKFEKMFLLRLLVNRLLFVKIASCLVWFLLILSKSQCQEAVKTHQDMFSESCFKTWRTRIERGRWMIGKRDTGSTRNKNIKWQVRKRRNDGAIRETTFS